MATADYQYRPLPNSPDDPNSPFTIRLLHLLPSTEPNAPIQCHLVETTISGHLPTAETARERGPSQVTHDEYHALSYTWGDPVFSRSIEVVENAAESRQASVGKIRITENLHSALQSLRKPDRTLVLWADAVCINQADIPERNSQVSNMPQTYSEASSVVVWLGADSIFGDARLCLDFFTELTGLILGGPNGEYLAEASSWRGRFQINHTVATFLETTQPNPIASFLEKPWFRRRWIVQEVVLAKEVTLYWGKWSIPWTSFETAIMELYENDRGCFTPDHRLTMRTMTRMRHADAGAKRQIPLDTLVEFSCFICANPRDRLYALYGVIQHWIPASQRSTGRRTGHIDYALSTEEVFTNFALLMLGLDDQALSGIEYKAVTHVLQLAAAFRSDPLADPGQPLGALCSRIPSWVVNWTETLSYETLYHSPADRNASSGVPRRQVEVLPPREDGLHLLVITGVPYDLITACIALDTAPLFLVGAVHEAKKALSNFLQRVAGQVDEKDFSCGEDGNTYIPTGQHIVAAIATAIVANWEHTPPNSYFAQHPRFPGDFIQQLGEVRHHLPEILHKWPAYVELVTITMRGRGLFLTASGYIGISSDDVEAGDVVCLLSDVRVPFILRPQGQGIRPEMDNKAVVIPGCQIFHDEDQYRDLMLELREDASAHTTFRLMGDAYVHGLMDGEAFKSLGSELSEAISILPIE